MKIILLNGPPRSGKDTAAAAIIHRLAKYGGTGFIHEKFSAPLKTAFAGMMDVKMHGWNVGQYEDYKEKEVFNFGFSFRKWQQDFSEKFMKPCYGEDIFGRMLWSRLYAYQGVAVISDCGFQIEVNYLLEHIHPKDVLLLRIERPGATFEGDTREYVNLFNGQTFVIHNDKTKEAFEEAVVRSVNNWLGRS